MSEITSFIRFKGKVGNAVARRSKGGKAVMYEKPNYPNPKSTKQTVVRNTQSFSAKFASLLGAVGRAALVANGFSKNKFYELVKILFPQVEAWGGSYYMNAPLVLVKHPSWLDSLASGVTITASAERRDITVELTGISLTTGDSVIFSAMIKDENDNWYFVGEGIKEGNSITFGDIDKSIPMGESCQVHAFAIGVKATTDEGRAILSQINTPGESGVDHNLSVDINRLGQDSFLYTPVYAGTQKNIVQP